MICILKVLHYFWLLFLKTSEKCVKKLSLRFCKISFSTGWAWQTALKAHWQISKKWCFEKYYSCVRKLRNWQQICKPLSLTFCFLKLVEKKKLLGLHNKDIFLILLCESLGNSCFITLRKMQKEPQEFCKKAVLKSSAIFTSKNICIWLFLIQNVANFFRASNLKNICEQLLLKEAMELRKIKIVNKGFKLYIKKQDFSTSISETSENVFWKCFYFRIVFT